MQTEDFFSGRSAAAPVKKVRLARAARKRAPGSTTAAPDLFARPAEAPAAESETAVYSVSALTRLIRLSLENNFATVWVEGEISTLRQPQSGHVYFTLKDDKAQLRCVMFRGAAQVVKFQLQDGMACVVRGRVSVYDAGGQYQLYVEAIEPRGKGALQLAFEQLKARLDKEGLFAAGRKRPLPLLPGTIGIATSATGAAIRDMLQVINRRYANVHVVLRPCLVQGPQAAADIAQALADLNAWGRADVIIVGRGGGSMEDLWPFNEEIVARAVAASAVPVISAVGHEIDVTICDFVADVRAPTPSAAAELVVQEKVKLRRQVDVSANRLRESLRQTVALAQSRLQRLRSSHALQRPRVLVRQYEQRLDNLEEALRYRLERRLSLSRERLTRCGSRLVGWQVMLQRLAQQIALMRRQMDTRLRYAARFSEQRLAQVSGRLTALNPLAVLARGYSMTTDQQGVLVRSCAQINPGDCVRTRLSDGTVISRVEEIQP